jgi:hypothetical protein
MQSIGPTTTTETKWCPGCEQDLPVAAFSVRTRICKGCAKVYNDARYQRKQDQLREERRRRYRAQARHRLSPNMTRCPRSPESFPRKVSVEQFKLIEEQIRQGRTQADVAREYGVYPSAICRRLVQFRKQNGPPERSRTSMLESTDS